MPIYTVSPYPQFGPPRFLAYPYTQHITDTWLDPNDPGDAFRLRMKRQRARKAVADALKNSGVAGWFVS